MLQFCKGGISVLCQASRWGYITERQPALTDATGMEITDESWTQNRAPPIPINGGWRWLKIVLKNLTALRALAEERVDFFKC